MAQFDYVSDLHIDYWDPKWHTLYMPNGPASDFPLQWDKMKIKSDILVVAGDVSDKLEYSIEYLKSLRKYYRKILFVDGNHEHTYQHPRLYTRDYIAEKFKGIENVHYLPKEDVIVDRTLFIGLCGWWDYGCKGDMEVCYKFSQENPRSEKILLAKRIVMRAYEEAEKMKKKIERHQNNDKIKDIVIVTHTLPLPKYARRVETEYNHFFRILDPELISGNSKIKRWVFGHTHDEWVDDKYGIRMMCHPRGRPEDHNRETYEVRTSKLT
jgi:hypothetical protein